MTDVHDKTEFGEYTKTELGISYQRYGPGMGMWELDQIPKELFNSERESKAVTRSILSAYTTFNMHHTDLMRVSSSERSITHKLAEEIQKNYHSDYWSVDCEYNRSGDIVKRMPWLKGLPESDLHSSQAVLPDIIVHKRGSEDNLAVIEVKKDTVSSEAVSLDVLKLFHFKKSFGYRYAFFCIVGTGPTRDGKRNPGMYRVDGTPDEPIIVELDYDTV